ncbi:unnamed protein product [Polarella glacialis]|uniref:Uncharacterized protein n=1 Tax=Polarella glacialis TaxID=89957 RepID=A0A813JSS7_POLGL|nr:unnamed protein product [Polarella glacialis]
MAAAVAANLAETEKEEVKRWVKADLEASVTGQFKTFCKEKCAQCDKPATKRFSTSMSFVVSKMLESFWCPECGRVLCESHRYQHTCERLDEQKERNKKITPEQLMERLAQAEALKQGYEAEQKAEARQVAEAQEQQRLVRKDKRLTLAKKAGHVSNFLQGVLRDTDANELRGKLVKDELFELFTRAKRIGLTLYNEYEHPSLPELAEDEWADIKEIYKRSRELTRMTIMVEGEHLDMKNPWDPPPPPEEANEMADVGGLGRGLL